MHRPHPENSLPALVLAFAVLMASTLIITLSSVVHRSIFEIVPPDGVVSLEQRVGLDEALTRYLTNGEASHLAALSEEERIHLGDVRALVLTGAGLLIMLGGISWRLGVSYERVELALVFTLVIAALVTVSFQTTFYEFHRLFFWLADGPWIFDPARYVLTQIYPLTFFQVGWVTDVAISVATLSAWGATLRHRRKHTHVDP